MPEIIKLAGVSKVFVSEKGHEVLAVDNVNITVNESEFVCLLGPSGSGKSTILRMLAGLTPATTGKVEVLGQEVRAPRSEGSMVLQDYSLLPWRSVVENVAFGLELRRVPKEERLRIAHEMVEMVGLAEFAHASPYELSGGMQQRAAIARALATNPRILYMDEPFGALDAFTRRQMQQELLSLWLKDKKTVVFVTHSVEEAVYLATRIIVMSARPGRVIADFPVDIPYPRRSSDVAFGKMVDDLMHMLMELAYER